MNQIWVLYPHVCTEGIVGSCLQRVARLQTLQTNISISRHGPDALSALRMEQSAGACSGLSEIKWIRRMDVLLWQSPIDTRPELWNCICLRATG